MIFLYECLVLTDFYNGIFQKELLTLPKNPISSLICRFLCFLCALLLVLSIYLGFQYLIWLVINSELDCFDTTFAFF